MQLKNSVLLLTALTAGSAVARTHGHQRRHAAAHEAHEAKRAVGDVVVATIDGKAVSWINEYAGAGAATATATATATAAADKAAAAAAVVAAETTVASAAHATATATSVVVSSAAGSCSAWDDTSSDDDYSRDGFGEKTVANLLEYIWYKGNVGSPWGSNIIEVAADKACQYKHVIRIDGSEKDPWTLVFWNKMGPDGKLTGWYGNSALKLSLQAGETKYVAFDDDSQGAWGAAKGDSLPTDQYGGYSCTWGEFDFSNQGNNNWSGWDVSAIQAQVANQEVQGMKICDNLGGRCSSITNLATKVDNAYTAAEEGVDGIGGSIGPGPVRLVVAIDYSA
ncbi:hypothetical protein P175DRAFT_0428313 [Aspergillus ochraceoroseus IBT 24754]|uniref:Allergen Asp f 4 n=3 Tax=Aspergillus subgen. Nidulantes TaxID=2720870 RepID=A0A0F8VJ48_9EURO|nr:uncharacterized protein P175DRAFT_0428313 [Aspergillus ochraceoroseus IBT 24754]KKK17789.1 hypothetical protein AOCH_006842 [Aspergillus ochraceoroseus]KKK23126.1 hypothetical protein ARAM_007771 [Aspergillus rambellii]PTU25020.1 hypothetical protein P175DRAFT_0428313 [Aspergillus ochraceoroseus IBT 24754]